MVLNIHTHVQKEKKTILNIHNYAQKERKVKKKRRGEGWNDHTWLGTDCAQTKCLAQVMSRRSMEHQPLHHNSQVATCIKTDQ